MMTVVSGIVLGVCNGWFTWLVLPAVGTSSEGAGSDDIWEWFSLMPSEDRGCGQLWRHVKLKEERETGEESGQKTWINSRERLERMGE